MKVTIGNILFIIDLVLLFSSCQLEKTTKNNDAGFKEINDTTYIDVIHRDGEIDSIYSFVEFTAIDSLHYNLNYRGEDEEKKVIITKNIDGKIIERIYISKSSDTLQRIKDIYSDSNLLESVNYLYDMDLVIISRYTNGRHCLNEYYNLVNNEIQDLKMKDTITYSNFVGGRVKVVTRNNDNNIIKSKIYESKFERKEIWDDYFVIENNKIGMTIKGDVIHGRLITNEIIITKEPISGKVTRDIYILN